jgi:hypothetical protein
MQNRELPKGKLVRRTILFSRSSTPCRKRLIGSGSFDKSDLGADPDLLFRRTLKSNTPGKRKELRYEIFRMRNPA